MWTSSSTCSLTSVMPSPGIATDQRWMTTGPHSAGHDPGLQQTSCGGTRIAEEGAVSSTRFCGTVAAEAACRSTLLCVKGPCMRVRLPGEASKANARGSYSYLAWACQPCMAYLVFSKPCGARSLKLLQACPWCATQGSSLQSRMLTSWTQMSWLLYEPI